MNIVKDKEVENAIKYEMSLEILKNLLYSKLITKQQMSEIDALNRQSFQIKLAELY